MATVTKTWTFDADLEGAAIQYPSAVQPVWYAEDGDPDAGCVRFEQAAPDLASSQGMYFEGTWEDWGVPAGGTVTAIVMACRYKTVAGSNQIYAFVYDVGWDSDILLDESGLVSATWADVAAMAAYAVPSGNQASTSAANVWLSLSLQDFTGDLRVDTLALTMTYTEGGIVVPPVASGEPMFAGVRRALAVSASVPPTVTYTGTTLPTLAYTGSIFGYAAPEEP